MGAYSFREYTYDHHGKDHGTSGVNLSWEKD